MMRSVSWTGGGVKMTDKTLGLVMDLVSGGDLFDYITRNGNLGMYITDLQLNS